MQRPSSFKKAGAPPQAAIPGMRISAQQGQTAVSTGLAELDGMRHHLIHSAEIIQGGLLPGTVVLFEEDINTTHYFTLLKYFAAEGLVCGNALMFASADVVPHEFLRSLPALTEESVHVAAEEEEIQRRAQAAGAGKDLSIAWRYKDSVQKSREKERSTPKSFCHSFDLSKPIQSDYFEPRNVELVDVNALPRDSIYQSLYALIAKAMATHQSGLASDPKNRNLLRVVLHSLASPLWHDNSPQRAKDLLSFLHALRGLVRNTLTVCELSIPAHLLSSSTLRQAEHMSDTAFLLQSFQDPTDHAPAFDDHTGMFFIRKISAINTLSPALPDTLQYTFTRKRRKLYVERISLGPEESRNASGSSSNAAGSLLCAPGPPGQPSHLEF